MQDAHDILVAAAENAPPAEAVVLLAEAAEAGFYAARPRSMLRAAQACLGGAAGAGRRARALLRDARARDGAHLHGRGRAGAQRLREATTVLERSDALSGDPRLLYAAAMGPLWLREAERGRALVARAIESARATGAVGALPTALWLAARDAATSDRFAVAVALYEEAIRLARETGQATALCAGLAGLACVEALQGAEAACREHAAEALERTGELGLALLPAVGAGRDGDARARPRQRRARGRVADGEGAAARRARDRRPGRLAGARARRGAPAPRSRPGPRLEAFAAAAEAKGQPWSLARLARCRGLLTGSDERFAEALRLHARTPDRFEEARTCLC